MKKKMLYFIIVFGIILICLITYFFSPRNYAKNAELNTNKHAKLATREELNRFRKTLQRKEFNDDAKTECTIYDVNPDYSVRICSSSYYDTLATTAIVEVIDRNTMETIVKSEVDRNRYTSSDLDIATDIHNGLLYISWIKEEQASRSIYLRCIDIKKAETIFDKVIFPQNHPIASLNIAHHPKTDLLLVAFTDYISKNSASLFLGKLRASEYSGTNFKIGPKPVFLTDSSEKRHPTFFKTDEKLFLYHTTGDTWGLLSHSGKQGVGFSEIDLNGKLIGYSIIADQNSVNNKIHIFENFVFYQHVIGKNRADNELKKINIKDVYKPFRWKN